RLPYTTPFRSAVGGRAEHPEFPAFGPELGDGPVVGDRPAALQALSGREVEPFRRVCCALPRFPFRLTHASILTDGGRCARPGPRKNGQSAQTILSMALLTKCGLTGRSSRAGAIMRAICLSPRGRNPRHAGRPRGH